MKVEKHRLKLGSGKFARFVETSQKGGELEGGKPSIIIVHYTAGGSAAGAIDTFTHGEPGRRTSAHLVIDRDGTITQLVPFDHVGWHAGPSSWRGRGDVNLRSVGIELVNWGKLNRTAAGGWVSDRGASIPPDRVVLAAHKHFPGSEHGWEIYDVAQVDTLVAAASALVQAYGMQGWDLVGHEDVSPFRKVDPGPALRLDAIRSRVFGREDDAFDDRLFKVHAPGDGLNLREKPALADSRIIKKLVHGATVHVIERIGAWALVAEVLPGGDDVTGYAHGNWLVPA
jgi:N-acetylmuramoyl-L-alanine amidase